MFLLIQLCWQDDACCRKYNIDGLDLHWNCPNLQNDVPADKENFVSLLKVSLLQLAGVLTYCILTC